MQQKPKKAQTAQQAKSAMKAKASSMAGVSSNTEKVHVRTPKEQAQVQTVYNTEGVKVKPGGWADYSDAESKTPVPSAERNVSGSKKSKWRRVINSKTPKETTEENKRKLLNR